MKKQTGKNAAKASAKKVTAEPPFRKGVIRDYFEFIMWGMSIFIFFYGFVWQNFKIPTSSMENNLLIGDHITLNTFIFSPKATALEKTLLPHREIRRGDVVVFKYPGDVRQKWVKRCIGLPGDQFEIRDARVYINGDQLKEEYPYFRRKADAKRDPENKFRPMDYNTLKPGIENALGRAFDDSDNVHMKAILANTRYTLRAFKLVDPAAHKRILERLNASDGTVIPEGFYMMMGDNRNFSFDSRKWGLVPRELIEGRPYWVWWSYGEDEGTHEAGNVKFMYYYLRIPFTIFSRTHWSDCFSRIR